MMTQESKKNLATRITLIRELTLIGLIVIITAITYSVRRDFISLENIRTIFSETVILLIIAVGEMLVIITGNIDLSPSAISALSGVVVAYGFQNYGHINLFLVIIISLAIGLLFGMINGLLVGYGNVPSFIATLGLASIIRGIAFFIVGGTWIGEEVFSVAYRGFASTVNLLIMVVIVILTIYFFLSYFKAGRNIYAIGTNRTAAELIGVKSNKVILYVFAIAGVLAGLSGAIWSSRYGVAHSDSALGFELTVIIAVIIGGTSIVGGRGSIRGVVISAFLLEVITNALGILGVSQFWKMAVQGILILVAFSADSFVVEKTSPKLI